MREYHFVQLWLVQPLQRYLLEQGPFDRRDSGCSAAGWPQCVLESCGGVWKAMRLGIWRKIHRQFERQGGQSVGMSGFV